MMPYSSFMSGGYKSMNCGYGYTKGSDGSCQQMSWVSSKFFDALFRALMIRCSTKPRAVTRRSSSTSESLIDAPHFRRVCSQTSSSGGCSGSDCGSYNNGYNNNCGGMSTVTKTMTDTETATKTQTQHETDSVTQTVTQLSTIIQPTTYFKTYVQTSVIDNVSAIASIVER